MVLKADASIWHSTYVKVDGTSAVYLRVKINGNVVPQINLEADWPREFFIDGLPIPRFEGDQQAEDNKLLISEALARCNSIFIEYRLAHRPLLVENFLQDFHDYGSKVDFIEFFDRELKRRYKKRQITERTYKNHNNTLNKLKDYSAGIPFGLLSWRFGEDFDSFLEIDCNLSNQNTRWTHHKDVKTYLNRAKDEHIRFEDPYARFSINEVDGDWLPIRPSDLDRLREYFDLLPVGSAKREALRKFLFSSYSGLRISDIKRLQEKWINFEHNRIHFRPHKQKAFDVVLDNRLPDKAMELLKSGILENKGNLVFADKAEQYENRKLKEIGQELDITEPLHFHVGRHTFCTMFIEKGGSEAALRRYMGWKKASMTKKYVKPHMEVIDSVIDRL